MPNHVENIIRLKGDERRIKEMLTAIQDDECGIGTIDFNKIIPMPDSLDISAGSATDRGLKAYQEFITVYTLAGTIQKDLLQIPKESEDAFLRMRTDIKSDEWELGRAAFQNIQRYGSPTWYDWRNAHWGTKWNAYEYEPGIDYSENEDLCFQTAWAAPHPILEKLAEMYPELTFEHEWADEDIGWNCGRRIYHDGKRIEEYYPEGMKAAVEFATAVWDYDLDDLHLVLNKTETDYIRTDDDTYDVVEVCGQTMLFTNERLTDEDIPAGFYCYHLRESDDGGHFCSIEPRVAVNHGGSVIAKESIDFGEQGHIVFRQDTEPNFLGEHATIEEYMQDDFSQEQSTGGMQQI